MQSYDFEGNWPQGFSILSEPGLKDFTDLCDFYYGQHQMNP